jgi:predicted glutamine amidotransferase
VPTAGHELQRPDRHLLFVHRLPGRGGATDVHSDGWGIAFFEGRAPASSSTPSRPAPRRSPNWCASTRSVRRTSSPTSARRRRAPIGLENTHPFMRELWGRYWIFAHNGNLLDFAPALDGSFIPVGLTDSERAFCWLLQELRQRFGSTPPAAATLFAAIHELTLESRRYGEFNFLLSNGDWLFAHASTKLSLHRAPGAVRPGPPQGSGCDGRFQRRHDSRRPRGRHRHAAADRQRNLDGPCRRNAVVVRRRARRSDG